jgi:hypothetical protein
MIHEAWKMIVVRTCCAYENARGVYKKENNQ